MLAENVHAYFGEVAKKPSPHPAQGAASPHQPSPAESGGGLAGRNGSKSVAQEDLAESGADGGGGWMMPGLALISPRVSFIDFCTTHLFGVSVFGVEGLYLPKKTGANGWLGAHQSAGEARLSPERDLC